MIALGDTVDVVLGEGGGTVAGKVVDITPFHVRLKYRVKGHTWIMWFTHSGALTGDASENADRFVERVTSCIRDSAWSPQRLARRPRP